MKSYLFGLILKIVLLAMAVAGVFVLLFYLGPALFQGSASTAATPPKNILLVLMESYEKSLLDRRAALEKERTVFIEKLAAAPNRTERRQIENELKELERRSAETNTALAGVTAEKKDLEAREREKEARLQRLSEERRKASDEVFTMKQYWNTYTEKLKNEFLALAKTEADRERIVRSFQEDNGLSHLIAFAREYAAQNSELDETKGATAATREELDKTLADKTKAEAFIREMEAKIAALNSTIAKNEGELKIMQTQIETLVDVGQIKGFFISRNNRTELITNRKLESEILATGQFIVYNNKRAAVSKIYVSKKGSQIVFTKVPGYDNPKPGDWF